MKKSTIDPIENICLTDIISLVEIQRLQDLFSDATGVASIVTYPDGTPITSPSNFCRLCNDIIRKTDKGLANCMKSNAALGRQNMSGPIIQPCLGGNLWNAGASITVGGKHIANWLVGQIRNKELDEQQMVRYAGEIGANLEEFRKALDEVPVMSSDKFNKVAKMLFAFAGELSARAYSNWQLKIQIAEREKATELWQKNEEQYRNLFEQSNDAIFLVDTATGNYLDANRAAEILTGRSLAELKRLKTKDITPQGAKERLERLLVTTDPLEMGEVEYIRPDQTTRTTILHTIPLNNNRVLGIAHDITERKQAEEALSTSEARHGKMIANIGDVIVIIDRSGTIRYKSPNIEKWFGWKPEEVVGENVWKNVHPEDVDSMQKTFVAVLGVPDATGTTECRYRCKDGSYKWIEFTGINLLHDPDVGGILGNYRDITERKRIDEELRENEKRLNEAQHIAMLGNWELNLVTNELIWSDEIYHIFEINQAEFGASYEAFLNAIHPDDRDLVNDAYSSSLKNRTPYEIHHRLLMPDGRVKYVHERCKTFYNDERLPLRSVGIVQDITERKHAEEKILKANRLYAVISQINQTIVRTRDRDQLFEEVCRIAVEYGKFRMAWIGLVDEEMKRVNPVAIAGNDAGYLSSIRQISVNLTPDGKGPTGIAILAGQHSVCDDIESDPNMALWREEALKRGYRSSIALPINPFGKTIGAFNIYAATPHFFDQAEIELLNEVTSDISFALETIETEKKRVEAEEALLASEERYRELYENVPVMNFTIDLTGKIIHLNQFGAAELGYTVEELVGKPVSDIYSDEDKSIVLKQVDICLQNPDQFFEWELRKVHKNGQLLWVHEINHVVKKNERWEINIACQNITERKRAEALLIENSKRYEALITVSNTGAWEYHLDTDFLWCSPEYFSMLGRDINQFDLSGAGNLNETWIDLLHPEERQRASGHFSDYLKNGSVGMYENYFRMKHSDGHWVWILSRGSTLRDENGKITNLTVGTHIDITERKLEEEKLHQSRKQLRFVADNAPVAIAQCDENLCYKFVNLQYAKMFGMHPADLKGKLIQDVLGEEAFAFARPYMELALAGQQVDFEIGLHTAQNGPRILSVKYSPEEDKSGRVVGFIAAITDITTRKQVEEALEISRKELEEYFENDISANYLVSVEGEILSCNKTFLELFGFEKKSVPEKFNITQLYKNPDEREKLVRHVKEIGKVENYELDFITRRGDTIHGLINAIGIFNDAGELVNTRVYLVDITARKKAENELIIAKEKAEESDRLKSAFLANMSHEVRTPMNGLLGFAEMLKDPDLTAEQQQEYINIMDKSGARMLNIINDVIDISKIESGQMKVSVSEINLNEQIRYIYNSFKPEAEQKGLQLLNNKALADEGATIKTDRNKLYAILYHLVSNAIKYTHEGSVEFGYQIEGPLHTTSLQFYVKDTGIGIRQEHTNVIFERFRQASESYTRQYEGAGLGLAISKSYVEMLGGKIWVESEQGKGSVFYFTLPYLK